MKTKTFRKNKINLITLGCSKNLVDSEVILTQLKGNQVDARHQDPDFNGNIVVINTCGFIDQAKQESIDTILAYTEAKEKGKVEKVFVTGCLSERYRDDLKKEIPQVDDWFGTMELPLLLKRLNADYKKELLGERITTTDRHYAYLKISEGCDRLCSFCAIPLMRGKHRSRPIEELVDEAKSLVKKGTRELLLIAQDSTYYGLDLYKKRNLAELLDRLADIDNLDWIRLHYAFPTGFPENILDVMRERPNICNYLDIPLQHAADNVLTKMRRGTTREKTERLLEKIRLQVPGIAIRTTMIVGHPGESEADFDELMNFVETQRFDRLGVFTYSHEEKTHAYGMPDDVCAADKESRASQLMDLQEGISLELNEKKIGTNQRVLIDRWESDHFVGRTAYDSPEVDNEVLIYTDKYLRIGDFTQVQITGADAFDLIAEPIVLC